jgi:hypothetical protein
MVARDGERSADPAPAGSACRAKQAAEKPFQAVILSEAKNLALSDFKAMRDPSSPAVPQDDSPEQLFRSL